MLFDACAQAGRPTDIECAIRASGGWQRRLGVEGIHARHIRHRLQQPLGQARRARAGRLHRALDSAHQHRRLEARLRHLHELPQGLGVAHRPVACAALQAMALDEGIESVPMMFGKECTRQLDGAQHAGVEVAPQARERRLDEAEVEARVVGDEDAARQQALDALKERVKARRLGNHLVADSGHALDQWRNGDVRQHQTFPAFDEHAILDPEDGNLGDPVTHRVSTGTLDIDEGQPRWQPPAQASRRTPEQAHAFSATRLSD